MPRTVLFLSLVALLVLAATPLWAAGEEPESRIRLLLRQAADSRNDQARIGKLLAEVDAEMAARPNLAVGHYARGWMLSRLGRPEEALAAYDRATELAPKLGDAYYNAGVILAELGREAEALKRWYAASEVDATNADAFYNAGQLHYNRKEFAKALERWSGAQRLVPRDFDTAKKVLQAHHALGDRAAAAKARERVLEIWRTSQEEAVRKLTEYCFDQFDVGKAHVFAYEAFEPNGPLYSVYTFRVTHGRTVVGSVQLESSPALREQGTPYVLGVTKAKAHETTDLLFRSLPSYDELKPLAITLIEKVSAGN